MRPLPRQPVNLILSRDGKAKYVPPVAVPRAEWPQAVQLLARLARDGDTGIGDVAHRVASAAGGEGLAKLYTRLTGRACGCSDRQTRLNQLYPL